MDNMVVSSASLSPKNLTARYSIAQAFVLPAVDQIFSAFPQTKSTVGGVKAYRQLAKQKIGACYVLESRNPPVYDRDPLLRTEIARRVTLIKSRQADKAIGAVP